MSKKAIIFLNMGAPRDLDEVELFLKNMFNDKNIITIRSDLLREFISFMITSTRKNEAKSNYEKLGGISPLVNETQRLLERIRSIYPECKVVQIMRYTPPFAKGVISDLKDKGVSEAILFPLYPHYSTTTVKSSLEDFYEVAKKLKFDPKIKLINPYYKDKLYNKAIVKCIKKKIDGIDTSTIDLIFSAHSLPQKIIDRGDSYQDEVIEHTKILTDMIKESGILFHSYNLAYQSKLGPIKWLEPALDQVIKDNKNKRALIVPISFTLDNSETIFELDMEYRELANSLNYKFYEVASAPNSSDLLIEAFRRLIDDR